MTGEGGDCEANGFPRLRECKLRSGRFEAEPGRTEPGAQLHRDRRRGRKLLDDFDLVFPAAFQYFGRVEQVKDRSFPLRLPHQGQPAFGGQSRAADLPPAAQQGIDGLEQELFERDLPAFPVDGKDRKGEDRQIIPDHSAAQPGRGRGERRVLVRGKMPVGTLEIGIQHLAEPTLPGSGPQLSRRACI